MQFRTTQGVKGITLKENDKVVSFDVISANKKEILIATSNGLGKRFQIEDIALQNRGGKGKIISKLKDDSYVVSAHLVSGSEKENLIIQSKTNIIKIKVNSLSKVARTTYGNRIIKLNNDDIVTSTSIEQTINED